MTHRTVLASLLAALFASACGAPSSQSALSDPPAGQAVTVLTSPLEADVAPGASVQFGADVTGTANTAVVWSVEEAGGGTVSATGLYTAPTTEGTFHVRADSAIASAKSNGKSVVRVKSLTAAQQVAVAVNPGSINLLIG